MKFAIDKSSELEVILEGSIWDENYDIPRCSAFFNAIRYLESAINHRHIPEKFVEFAFIAIQVIVTARTSLHWATTNREQWEKYEYSIHHRNDGSIVWHPPPTYILRYRANLFREVTNEIETIWSQRGE